MAGFTGGVAGCVNHAVDGFTLWGLPLGYDISEDMSVNRIKKAPGGTATYLRMQDIITKEPWATGTEGDISGSSKKGINQGQIRAVAPLLKSTA